MNCPYCDKEMKKGDVKVGDALESIFKVGEQVMWFPEGESKKFFSKNTVNLAVSAEGYYCQECKKVVAIFNERGAGFLQ